MHIFRRLFDWVLHWGKTPFAVPALFLLALAESSFFPIPPDVLLLALGLSIPTKAFRFAAICTIGSVVGGVIGYGIGFGCWQLSAEWFFHWVPGFTPEVFQTIQQLFSKYDFWFVFFAGFTPIPYKVITIGAGVFHINFPIFILASTISRGLRFYLISILVYRYGDKARIIIDRHFNVLTSIFALLLIGGFIAVRYLF
ncbi:MAG: VTT domain-containing protein [Thermodesulfobacteriota bacterium]|nr:VTT domain-containing protein [Thermodesulfobacteriota bacterium]